MKYKIEPYSIHELGKRQNQEDSLFPNDGQSSTDDRLFILCDGMGGHEKGEVASSTVCEAISKMILSRWHTDEPLSDELLLQAIDAAYDALDEKDDNAVKKMGTTLTLLCLHANGATVAHIGDSRVYQFRPSKGIVFRTQDHSLVNDLVKIGEITEEEAKTHPQKNVITRAMQPHQPHRAKADIAHLTDIQSGDYFFLCSDGMLEQTSDENLFNVITKQGISNEEKVNMLRNLTDENSDNHTAHLIYIDKVKDNGKWPKNISVDNEPQGVRVNVNRPTAKTKVRFKWHILVLCILVLAFVSAFSFKMGCLYSDTKERIIDTVYVKKKVYIRETKKDSIQTEKKDSANKNKPSAQDLKPTDTPEQMPITTPKISRPKAKDQKSETTDTKKTNNKKQEEKHATTDQGKTSTWRRV